MGGLNKVIKMYGAMTFTDRDGKTTKMVWDHVADKAVPETEMEEGSERWKASEEKKWKGIKAQLGAEKAKRGQGF